MFLDRLSEQQFEIALAFSARRIGVSLEEFKEARDRHLAEVQKIDNDDGPSPDYIYESWRQNVENISTVGYPPNFAFMSSWTTPQFCETTDETQADPDVDYDFYTPVNIFSNPNGLRWTTNSSQVYTAFALAYSLNLNSYSFSFTNGVHSCLGQWGVGLAGGPNNVRANVFMHPNN